MKTLKHSLIKTCFFILLLFSSGNIIFADDLNIKATYTGQTVAPGGLWTTASCWNPTGPPDPTTNKCNLTINHNITYNPTGTSPWLDPFNWNNNISITINSGATLTINSDLNIWNNFTIIINPGGQFIVDGDLWIKNNVSGSINGSIYVTGNLTVVGGGSSSIGGTGEIIVDGTITDPNGELPPNLINNLKRYLIVNNGNWNLNTSWSKTSGGIAAASPPNYQCIVYIENNFTGILNVDAEVKELNILSLGTLNIIPGKTLTVSNIINSSGTINIKSDATGTGGLIFNGSTAVSAICERYVNANRYSYVSSAMTSAPVSSFIYTSGGYFNPNFYKYNENSIFPDWMYAWEQVTVGNLTPGTGYAFYTDENYAYSLSGGTLINQNYSVNITNTPSAGGSKSWNLIANPFPCCIKADNFITENESSGRFTGALYFWDDDGSGGTGYNSNDYIVYTKGGATSGGNGTVFNGTIEPQQAFFVQALTSGALNFNTTIKTNGPATAFRSVRSDINPEIKVFRLSVTSQQGVYNDILIKFADDADENIDMYDGLKLKGNNYLAFYSMLNNSNYAIQGFPNIEESRDINLGIDADVSGIYTFKAEQFTNIPDKIHIMLEDTYEHKLINLRTENYTFNAFGSITDRFILHFNDVNTNQADKNFENNSNISINSSEKSIVIIGVEELSNIELYDITGKMVFASLISNSSQEINVNVPTGYYIAKILSNNRIETFKIYMD